METTLLTEVNAHATHATDAVGGGRTTVLARECAVLTRRFVDERNMQGNPLCVDKPIEVGCRTISSVGSKPTNKINNLRNPAFLLGTF